MTNKKTTKITAIIALIAIFGSIIWTWLLIIFETYFSWKTKQNSLSQHELNELLNNYSWSLNLSWTGINTSSWIINTTLTWVKK